MRGNHRSLGRKLQAPAPGLQKGGEGCGTRGCQETAASTYLQGSTEDKGERNDTAGDGHGHQKNRAVCYYQERKLRLGEAIKFILDLLDLGWWGNIQVEMSKKHLEV